MAERMWTVEEAAAKLGIHKMTLYNQIRKGQFDGAVNVETDPNTRPKWRIPDSALQQGRAVRERRTEAKNQEDSFVTPDVQRQRAIIQEIYRHFSIRTKTGVELPDEHNSSILVLPTLAYGPESAYIGASGREFNYVITLDEFGDTKAIDAREKALVHPAASAEATAAWRQNALHWRTKLEEYGHEVIKILGKDHPLAAKFIHDFDTLRDQHNHEEKVENVVWEIVTFGTRK